MPAPMEHFTRATLRFLRDVAQHNNKEWFHTHKHDYERHVRGPALALVPRWLAALPDTYTGRASKQAGAVSQPHRDLRFSRDKTPYRTHVAIRLRHRLAWVARALVSPVGRAQRFLHFRRRPQRLGRGPPPHPGRHPGGPHGLAAGA